MSSSPFRAVAALVLTGMTAGVAGEPAAVAVPSLREFASDRPDTTESPQTLNAGRTQVEMDVAAYTRTDRAGVRTEEWEYAPFAVRHGLWSHSEVAVFFSPLLRTRERDRSGRTETRNGHGDVTLRSKTNLWGNDGGPSAAAVIVEVKVPTATRAFGNDYIEPAAALPWSHELPAGWEVGAMTAVTAAVTERGRRPVWLNTVSFARELMTGVGTFLELTSLSGDGGHQATFNTGVTRALGRDAQIDCGVNVGLSRGAPDLKVFAGVCRRF